MSQPFVIETKSLTKYFGEHIGIDGVDIQVTKGDFYGFIGPNGSGKSTTIRILLGLIQESSGSASVFNQSVAPNQTDILDRIGYMPSEALFYKGMKVSELIRFSANLRGRDCRKEAQRLCDLFLIDTSKKVEELSLGNRKKVSIVCALQHRPELYLLDEPTSGLDPLMQKLFWQELVARNQEGATVFVSSHVLSEVQRYCHNAAIIRDGRIIIQDTVSKLVQTNAKRVTITGLNQLELSSMKDILTTENSISFLYNGGLNQLLEVLHQQRDSILDVSISDPDMDEIFMHYYENSAPVAIEGGR